MKLIVGYSMCKILILGLVVSSLVAEGRDFKWTRGGDWYNYFDTDSWKVGETDANEEDVIPGEGDDDWVWTGSSANYYFDMNGSSAVIKGFTYTNSWDTRNLGIRNGTLTFTSSFTNYYIRPNLYAGGKLIHASTASSRLGFSAAKSRFTVKSGAELEMYGTAYINNSDFIVESGGKAIFDFSFIQFDKDAFNTPENLSQDNLGIFNSGETSFPNGFTMHELTNSSGAPPNFYIRQKAGVMTLGSDMIFANPGGRNYGLSYFYLDGGTLHIIGDVEIYGFTAIEMTAGATANIEIDEGKMLDLTNMKFAENTTLNLIGSGTLKMKGNGPSRLNLAAFTGTINFVEHIELGEVSGYENTTFNIGDGGEHRRGVRIIANESFIDALEEVLILQEGWTIQREGKYFAAFPANQDPKVYYSKFNNDFFEYMNPEIWTTEKSDSAVSAEEYPGDNDYLYYGYLWNGNKNAVGSYTYGTNAFTHLHLLMGNKLHRIRGFNRQGANAYPDFQLTVSYGGLEIWETFTNKRVKATINANSRLEIAPTCHATFGWQGAINNYIIKGDGRFDCYGDLQIGSWRITNEANGTVNFSPKSFVLTHEGWHLNSCYFDNSGKMDFANGLIIR